MTVEYTVIEKVPSAEAFCHLRVAAGMSPRPLEGARAGLPHSCYGVHLLWQETPIAMGRIVGDGAINFDIVDVAVDPAHQGKGLGRLVMGKLVACWTLTPLLAPTLRWWRMCRNCTRSSASKAFARRARGWPASGEPAVVSSHFLPGKERCPNGNSSYGAFLTMLNAIHIARIP